MPPTLQLHPINALPPSTPPSPLSSSPTAAADPLTPPTSHSRLPQNLSPMIPNDTALTYHTHRLAPSQCCSSVIQSISAPLSTVWSIVRRFDNPLSYKHFLKSCRVVFGSGGVGSLREVQVISGLPAASSTERLDILDDEKHVMSFSVVGGEHRLRNYRSVMTLHPAEDGKGTVVVESYAVDVPPGNTAEETVGFVDTIIRCNLQSLAKVSETLAKNIMEA